MSGRLFATGIFFFSIFLIYRTRNDEDGSPDILYFVALIAFACSFGVMIFDAVKNKITTDIAEKKEEKEFQKNLKREADKIRAIGEANNHVKKLELEAETKALIARIKAGDDLQGELLKKYNELTAMGDSTFDYLKKEIQAMPAMKNTNFNL